jgi:glycosyltransferase involved in cell wall biosynthesis
MMMITEGLTKPDVYAVLTPKYKIFLERKIKGNIKCIPNGVDLNMYNSQFPSLHKYGLDELERPIILSTSALLIPKKRLHLAIKAVSNMERGTLVMTSTGPDKKQIISMGHKLLGNRFLYLGVLPDNELASLYATCDVFTLPSIREPFGLVLLEAMASNKPVVSQMDETRQWIVGEAGILVDCADIDQYATALEEAYQRDFGNLPRRQAEKFSWDNCVDRYLQAMEAII